MPAKLIFRTSGTGPDNVPASVADVVPDEAACNLSKVTPPTPHRVHLNRRLFARLDGAAPRPIVWIHGPPGAGKTTLAASYLANAGIDPLWYRLDEGDTDPATLFFYLAAASKGRRVGKTLPLLTPEFRTALPLFTRRFFRSLFACPKTAVLVFDDYHEVSSDALLHQCMANGLEEVPKGSRIIIISRTPPLAAFARLRLNGLLDVVEPEALRLSPDEADGLARQRGFEASAAEVGVLVRQTQGWAAGLILMMEAGTGTVALSPDDAPVPEALFDYFAGEILARMEPDAQRILRMLALLPAMTRASAELLTGAPEAGALLDDLRKRNYFTTKDLGAEARYRFHPLFRDFLLEGLRNALSPEGLRSLRVRGADILEEDGQFAAAAGLLAATKASAALAGLLSRWAPLLVEEGRHDTLIAWLAKLPPARIEADAWLSYWSGMARVDADPVTAKPLFERSFVLFEASGDVTGQFLAWAGQADAVRLDAFGDNARSDPLIDSLHELLGRRPELPSGIVMLRVAIGMAMALSRRRGDRDEIRLWQNRARQAVADAPGPGRAELVGFMFALTDFHDARYAEACDALDRLPDPLTLDRFPVAQINGLFAYAIALLYKVRPGNCGDYVEKALRKVEAAGFTLWAPLFAGMAARDAAVSGNIESCRAWLRKSRVYAGRVSTNQGAQYHGVATTLALMTGDVAGARTHADTGLRLAIDSGWYLFESYARCIRTEVFLDAAEFDEADVEIRRLDALMARSATRLSGFSAMLLKADLRLARGNEAEGRARLTEALVYGRLQGDRRTLRPAHRVARLYAAALRWNIEPDYVRRLIRLSELSAPSPEEAAWPWPLKIRTFGGLVIETNGEPLVFSRKTPKRLILLLKAMVTYGGLDVPEEKLIDAVWPDEDGDAGQSALKVAIHRLRQLLGDPGLILVKNGRVGLDPARCWLDVWSFERQLASRRPDETDVGFAERFAQGLVLYRGDFLADDEELWWIAERRERLRQRFVRSTPAAVHS